MGTAAKALDAGIGRERVLVAAAVALFAVLMTLKYFPGLENEQAYAGLAFQSIHPDSFAGDAYRGPDLPMASRPVQLSLTYVLARVVGEPWLDDRFLAVLYVGLVAIGLVGIDRTARLLGVSGLWERLIVLLVFLKDHAVLEHKVLLAHYQGFNHTAFAVPIIVWLFYAAIARKGLIVVLGLSVLLLAFSIRHGPIPIAIAVAVVAVTGKRWERLAIGGLFVAGLAFSYWVLFHAMNVPEAQRLELWDILLAAGRGDVNPFVDVHVNPVGFLVRNLVWMAVLGAAIVLSPADDPAYRGVRVVMALGLLTWLVGGLYLSHAPDFLKVPLLQGIAPTRALAWPQNLAYVALIALALRRLDGVPEPKRIALAGLALAVLFIVGPGNLDRWTVLLVVAAAAVAAWHWLGWPPALTGRAPGSPFALHVAGNCRTLFAQALAVAIAVSYAGAVWGKAPAWRTAFETGVFGDATPAAWIGVAEYIRDNTPPNASVLPIAYRRAPSYPALSEDSRAGRLWATRSLGTRAGRAMPVPEDFPGNFRDPAAWRLKDAQKEILNRMLDALDRRDLAATAGAVAELQPVPDYIVLPEQLLGGAGAAIGPYRPVHRLRGYALLKKNAP